MLPTHHSCRLFLPWRDGIGVKGAADMAGVTSVNAYFGRAPAIIQQRERIKRQTIEHRRLQHRKLAVQYQATRRV